MAKAKTGMMNMEGMDWGAMIVGLIMMALGLWFVVGGFVTQLQSTGRNFDWMVAVWYIIGIALFSYGKMWKHNAMCDCGMMH